MPDSEKFLYHRVPDNMEGNILHPLNSLRELHPEIYAEQIKKYEDRKNILERKVPLLECLWNDVLHFTAVHPRDVAKAYAKAGLAYKDHESFQVPAELITGPKSVVFTYKSGTVTGADNKEFEIFDLEKLEMYQQVPERTIDYYKKSVAAGKSPLVYQFVPHVLHKGSIDTSTLKTVRSID